MTSVEELTFAAQQVRRYDRERFVTALFAPLERREGLMTLYAFNLEAAKVRESVRETMAGLVRLQWWRDEVAAARAGRPAAGHPIAAPLAELIRAHDLPEALFDALLTAREQDLSPEPPADLDAAEAYAEHTSAGLTLMALRVLGAEGETTHRAARHVGIAWGLVGNLRALAFHLSLGRVTLPADVMRQHGVDVETMLAGRAAKPAVAAAVRVVAGRARDHLRQARHLRVDKAALPALLPATLASAHLALLERTGWDTFDRRITEPRPRPLRLALARLLGRF
jgi:phytoene/squalene synthetase